MKLKFMHESHIYITNENYYTMTKNEKEKRQIYLDIPSTSFNPNC